MITGSTIEERTEVTKNQGIFSRISCFFLSINRRFVIDLIIILIPIALIYIYMSSVNPSEIRETLKANKQIDMKVDSLRSDNQFIVERMYELEKNQTMFFDIINKNNDLIRENKQELLKLKRIYNAKINSISNYTVSQLDSFFTNRYKDYYK